MPGPGSSCDGHRSNPLWTIHAPSDPTRIHMGIAAIGPNGSETTLLASFPDPPRHPDEINSFRHLAKTGGVHYLAGHFGDPDTTVMDGTVYVSPDSLSSIKGLRAPDMLIAFDADPEACAWRNAYAITGQGKSPDFVLEVASRSTDPIDVQDKPADYAALGIPEYWRFDETGARLAGNRLVGDRNEAIEIMELPDGSLEDCSEMLDLKERVGA